MDGVLGGALGFDGAGDYVEIASSEELKLNTAGTVSVWVKPRDLYRHSIVNKQSISEVGIKNVNYWLTFGSSNQCSFIIGDGSDYAQASIYDNLTTNTWQHITGTWDSSEIRVYLNGVLADAQANPLSDLIRNDLYPLLIGNYTYIDWYFDGLIDDVRIYDVALSAGEVEELYGDGGVGLIAHWEFDEGGGAIAYDSAGDNDGVVYGADWVDGVFGGALEFDGVDGCVALPDNSPVWLPEYDFTCSLWVCFDTPGSISGHGTLLDLNNTSSSNPINDIGCSVKRLDSGVVIFGFNTIPGVTHNLYSNAVLAEGQWYHIVASRDGTNQAIYVNGNLDSSGICLDGQIDYAGGSYDDDRVSIGRSTSTNSPNGAQHVDGKMDDVRIYGRVLSADEVLGLYEDVPEPPESEVYHVDGDGGSDFDDGLSRATAFATIQKGIDSSVDGGEVVVWPGVYSAPTNFLGKAITVRSAGDAAVIEAPGQDAVTFHSGEGAGSVIKNFVIRNSGLAISANYGSSPTISNLTIVDNDYGIAAYEDSNPDISNCILWDNRDGDMWGCQARYSFVEQEIETGPVEGLIAQWRFDEGGGTTAGDSAGSSDGTINGAEWVIGQIGGALSFDGADDYVNIPDSDVFDVNDGDMSLSMWFKTSEYADQTLMKFRQYDDDPHLEVYTSTVYGNLGSRAMPGGAIVAYNAGRIDDGDWHHVAVSLENDTAGGYELYLDGTLVGMSTFSGELREWNAIAIGNDADGGGYFNGSIDDVRVYDRALSALDAYLLYEMSRGEPVAHWKFDEGAGSIAYDSAGSNDGVVYGADWVTGQIDGALSLDGIDDYVQGSSSDFDFEDSTFTVSAWFATTDSDYFVLVSEGGYSGGWTFGDAGGAGPGKMKVQLKRGGRTGDAYQGITDDAYNDGTWHHVAAVVTTNTSDAAGNNASVYVDGSAVTVTHIKLNAYGGSPDDWCIGARPVDPSYFTGDIDDVRIYDRGLSAGEVELVYEGGLIGQDDVDSLRPLFADAGARDYHLVSERGRYWPEHDVWVLDKVSSPCIDGGDPAIEPSGEQMPNGGAMNMGAYGGTEYASMSEWPIFSDYDRNGRSDFGDFAIFCDEWLLELPWVGGGS